MRVDPLWFWQQVALHLWQTTLALLAVALVIRVLPRTPAAALHRAYSLLLLKILVPNALVVALLPKAPSEGAWLQVRALLDPVFTPSLLAAPASAWTGILGWILTGAWALGAIHGLARLGRRAARACELQRSASSPPAALRALCAELGIPGRSVAVALPGAGLAGPVTVGLLRPAILLPAETLASSAPEELRAVLAHEDRHRRLRDPLRLFVVRALEALLFFYPPCSYVVRRWEQTNELLCDQTVLARGIDPERYLSALAASIHATFAPATVLGARFRSSVSLLSRFDRIQNPWRYRSMTRSTTLSLVALVCVAGGVFFAQAFRAAPVAAGDGEKKEAAFDTPPVLDQQYSVAVDYPESERKQGVSGTVMVSLDIAADGGVTGAAIVEGIEGHPAFEEEVLRVVKLWRFVPAMRDGQPVACTVQIPVKFDLC
jgi:TonB family protein